MKFLSRMRRASAAWLDREQKKTTTRQSCSLELACAVLLLEISLADSEEQAEETMVIRNILQEAFSLNEQATEALLATARKQRAEATSLHEFTHSINRQLPPEDRVAIVEKLWRVTHADQITDKYEEYYVRKIADLLHVAHRDYIKAKHRSMKAITGAAHKKPG